MRRAHFLKDNHACDSPQQAIWFDTETDFVPHKENAIYHKLRFGYACYMRQHRDGKWTDEKWLRFTTVSEYWDWCVDNCRDKTKLYLFCHNTSFDLPVLNVFKELPARGFELRSAIIDAPPTILRFRRNTQCIMILDTLNIWRMPLKYLGEEIGVEKLPMPEDNDLGVSWETYGRRDVEIIRDACLRWWSFLRDNDYGSFAPTLAGQATRVFRHRYMRHQILIDDNKKALELTREGYHGARCECFRIGKFNGNYTLLDVNSMYPDVMATKEYPRRLVSHTHYANISDIQNWLRNYCLTARIRIRTNHAFCAVDNGYKLIFPIGEFDCILSTSEISYALAVADIVDIYEVAVYEKAYLFTEMMNDLYLHRLQAKERGDKVAAFMYRKIMNSFYGKWGQNGKKWESVRNIEDLSCKHWSEYDMVTNRVISHRQLGGLVQRCESEDESRDSFPAIAGHITAYARMKLWHIICTAGLDNVFYCDTDSVLVNETGRSNLLPLTDAKCMGKLSVKGEYPICEIWGAKDYRFGDVAKTKGVRRDAVWLDSFNVQQALWSGLRGLVASGEVDKPITKTIKKHLSRNYDKGTVLADGRVLPLEFPQV